MARVTSKVEFPRSSPDGLIAMVETLLDAVKEAPDAVPFPIEKLNQLREKCQAAKDARVEAKKMADASVILNSNADKNLGIAIGQTLDDRNTVAGIVALFRNQALVTFDDNVEELKKYGFTVKVSQAASPTKQAKQLKNSENN